MQRLTRRYWRSQTAGAISINEGVPVRLMVFIPGEAPRMPTSFPNAKSKRQAMSAIALDTRDSRSSCSSSMWLSSGLELDVVDEPGATLLISS